MVKITEENAPKAVGATLEADTARCPANAMKAAYPRPGAARKRVIMHADGPSGRLNVNGQEARALEALVKRGASGVTALEMSSWAYRLGAYVHDLRHEHGLAIETIREDHEGGWHARYVLRSPVIILEVLS